MYAGSPERATHVPSGVDSRLWQRDQRGREQPSIRTAHTDTPRTPTPSPQQERVLLARPRMRPRQLLNAAMGDRRAAAVPPADTSQS